MWVDVKTNSQLEAERKARVGVAETQPPVLSGLAGDMRRKWEQAKRAKNTIEQAFLRAKRQRDGQYEPQKLASIKATFGAEYIPVYMMVTETKCRAAESWIKDILLQPDEEPWDIEPTPIPDIPEQLDMQIMSNVMYTLYQQAIQMSQERGMPFDVNEFKELVKSLTPEIKGYIRKQVKKKAKEAAKQMKEKISDQFAEGDWYDSLEDCIFDIVTYGVCFMKGPQMNKDLLRRSTQDESTGKWTNQVESEIIPKWQRRSPFNIYPAPDAVGVEDTYIFDLMHLTPKNLTDLLDVPGYSNDEIRACLSEYRNGGLKEWISIESEKARLEQRESMATYESEKIDCLHYMGSAQGQHLLDWGLEAEEIEDPLLEYNVEAWMIGTHIIKAMVNPDPLQKKPLCKACFNDDPDSFWGRGGVPALIEDIQKICNALARAIVNNVGMAAGPQVEYDKERLHGNVPQLVPWKVWISTGNQMRQTPAIKFYMPPLVADRLQMLYEFFLGLADEDSGIPRYAQGSTQVGGAGKTASGLSMLMTHAARGVKMFIKNIDRGIIQKSVQKQFYYNLDYEELDIEMIGDVKVVARGSSSLIAKEQRAVRMTEFMTVTNNPLDAQIIGMNGRKNLLEETAKSLEIDPSILFEEFEFDKDSFNNVMNSQQMGQSQGQLPPGQGQPQTAMEQSGSAKAPANLDVAGNVKSGRDYTLFRGQE